MSVPLTSAEEIRRQLSVRYVDTVLVNRDQQSITVQVMRDRIMDVEIDRSFAERRSLLEAEGWRIVLQ